MIYTVPRSGRNNTISFQKGEQKMYQKATIKKEKGINTKRLMLVANEIEKNLKAIKKIISEDQQDSKWLKDYENWKEQQEGIGNHNVKVTRQNPYFDESDFAEWEMMQTPRVKKVSDKFGTRQSGSPDPQQLELARLIDQRDQDITVLYERSLGT